MEISLTHKGDLHVLSVKGKIRLQNWRVLDKHLENLLAKDCRWLAMDLSGVTLICSTGIGSILVNVKRFHESGGGLLLVCNSAYMQDVLRTCGCGAFQDRNFFRDWDGLLGHAGAQGLAVSV